MCKLFDSMAANFDTYLTYSVACLPKMKDLESACDGLSVVSVRERQHPITSNKYQNLLHRIKQFTVKQYLVCHTLPTREICNRPTAIVLDEGHMIGAEEVRDLVRLLGSSGVHRNHMPTTACLL